MLSIEKITIVPIPWDHPDSIHLRNKQQLEISPDYITPPSAADVPLFLVAYHDGVPLGCGGLRPLSPSSENARENSAEIKRMFVDAAYRRRLEGDGGVCTSVATMILEKLEEGARSRGLSWLLLETGDFMTKARRFYERCGYEQRGLFGKYSEEEDSVCYEKWLGGVAS
jgi:putative acetyltransferase